MGEAKKTFRDLKSGDFIYEIRKTNARMDAYALKWVVIDWEDDPESNNYRAFKVKPFNGNRPDERLYVHPNKLKDSVYRGYYTCREEAVEAYKQLIADYTREANEEVIRLEKHLALARNRANKFTERLLKIK